MIGSRRHNPAFTVIELMVVIGIIVLALGLAVPVVRAIEGNHSLEAGFNAVSGALNHARQIAIFNKTPAGVAFYRDPVTGQQQMAFVEQEINISQDMPGLLSDPRLNSVPDSRFYDIIPGEEVMTLPSGLGVQLLSRGVIYVFGTSYIPVDKFLGAGIVLFDENGTLATTQQYWIAADPLTTVASAYPHMLGDRWHMNLNATTNVTLINTVTADSLAPGSGANPWKTPPLPATTYPPAQLPGALYGAPGVCIYNKDEYAAQIKPSTVSSNPPPEPFDNVNVSYAAGFNVSQSNQTQQTAPTSTDRQAEEAWLTANGQIYIIKPDDGSLLRNQ